MGNLLASRIFIRFLITNGLRGIVERILPARVPRSVSGVTLAKLGLSFSSCKTKRRMLSLWGNLLQSLHEGRHWTGKPSLPQDLRALIFFFSVNYLIYLNLIFFSFIFISWRLITLQYCSGFCHTLTWISHGFTSVPHPNPPSHLPSHPIPLGLPSAPALLFHFHQEGL